MDVNSKPCTDKLVDHKRKIVWDTYYPSIDSNISNFNVVYVNPNDDMLKFTRPFDYAFVTTPMRNVKDKTDISPEGEPVLGLVLIALPKESVKPGTILVPFALRVLGFEFAPKFGVSTDDIKPDEAVFSIRYFGF